MLKQNLKNDNNNLIKKENLKFTNNISIYFLKKIFFPYFNIFQNTEYYKSFNPKIYNLDFIYSYERKGDCSRIISDDLLLSYLPDAKKLNNYKLLNIIDKNYNYIYTTKHFKKQKSLFLYNDLFLRRRFFITENNLCGSTFFKASGLVLPLLHNPDLFKHI